MQNISPFLWFDSQAEQAANFYVALFPRSRILTTVRYGAAGPGPEGAVMTVAFELNGLPFTALNGGPQFTFSEAISFVINCDTQQEIDTFWAKLAAGGGRAGRCGWVRDKYGLSWQVVPRQLSELLSDADGACAERTMRALMQMDKLDIVALRRAHQGGSPSAI